MLMTHVQLWSVVTSGISVKTDASLAWVICEKTDDALAKRAPVARHAMDREATEYRVGWRGGGGPVADGCVWD
jgi:hypothetical protein